MAETVPQKAGEKVIPGKLVVNAEGFSLRHRRSGITFERVDDQPTSLRTPNQVDRDLIDTTPTSPKPPDSWIRGPCPSDGSTVTFPSQSLPQALSGSCTIGPSHIELRSRRLIDMP